MKIGVSQKALCKSLRFHHADVMLVQRIHMLSEVVYFSDGSASRSKREDRNTTNGAARQVGRQRLFKSRFDCSVMPGLANGGREIDRKIDNRKRGRERERERERF